ncbi:MAG: 3-isopropylmalate dehydratase small subunit [Thermodesulfobacteriota bacterium]|nr:3-isopropylmalate dehydratase small subunit [Thermodesulfobacteriota bacterium]
MKSKGKIWKFGDHVDTDLIIPARFLNVSDKNELAKNCFVDVKPDFARTVQPGDIIIAGINFGCGSSREHAPLAIKAAGISVIIAKSFARIFYRNAFNIGLPILESTEAADAFSEGDDVSVDLSSGEIADPDGARRFFAKPIPEFMREIIDAGGLVDYIRKKMAA